MEDGLSAFQPFPSSIFDGPTYSKASEQALIYAYLFNSRITVFTKDTYKYI